MRTSVNVISFVLVLCGGCASTPKALTPAQLDPDLAPLPRSAQEAAPAPPTVGGDIQFTMADRKAKTAPETDDTSAASTSLQPQKSSTSGVTSTGVTTQRIHSSQ